MMRWIILLLMLLALCGGAYYARATHEMSAEDMATRIRRLEGKVNHLESEVGYLRSNMR